jgi:hypothetical protein
MFETDRSNKANSSPVTAFLSCSVRPEDTKLVDGIARVLFQYGFRCLTVGRNVSSPAQVDDAIRELMNTVDCLIGIATARFEASEAAVSSEKLKLASPYILQETAMAHQRKLPFLIIKSPDVTLQGVTGRNLYVEVGPDMPNGRPVFLCSRQLLASTLDELQKRAIKQRGINSRTKILNDLGRISMGVVGVYAACSAIDSVTRPNCFGNYYYRAPECKDCTYKPSCKVEKAAVNAS